MSASLIPAVENVSRPTLRPGWLALSSAGGEPCPAISPPTLPAPRYWERSASRVWCSLVCTCAARPDEPGCWPDRQQVRSRSPPSFTSPGVAGHRVPAWDVAGVRFDGTLSQAVHPGQVEGVHAVHFDVQILKRCLLQSTVHSPHRLHQATHVGRKLDVAVVDAPLAKLSHHRAVNCLGHGSLLVAAEMLQLEGGGGRVPLPPGQSIGLTDVCSLRIVPSHIWSSS